ncbi:hypothetical protein ACFVOR_37490 [Streptomyces sp. NPDC057837]
MPTTATKPRIDYPRPPVVFQHRDLFREPAYEDGQPYTGDEDLEDDEP